MPAGNRPVHAVMIPRLQRAVATSSDSPFISKSAKISVNSASASPNLQLVRYLAQQPWVDSIAAAVRPPLSGTLRTLLVTPAGKNQLENAGFNQVSADYFRL